MNNLKASKIAVWVLILSLILVGCDYPASNGELEATPDEKDGIISGSIADTYQRVTEIAARFNICTSVGCHSTLRIDISDLFRRFTGTLLVSHLYALSWVRFGPLSLGSRKSCRPVCQT